MTSRRRSAEHSHAMTHTMRAGCEYRQRGMRKRHPTNADALQATTAQSRRCRGPTTSRIGATLVRWYVRSRDCVRRGRRDCGLSRGEVLVQKPDERRYRLRDVWILIVELDVVVRLDP